MSIPKEPRQLMINIMYLVLTAMLALNVSAEVMDAFFTLDKGNTESISTVNSQLDETVNGLNKLLDDDSKAEYRVISPAVAQVRAEVASFNSYIDDLRGELIDKSGNKNGELDDGDYKEDHGKILPKGKKDKDVTTRMFVNGYENEGQRVEPVGPALKARIIETRNKLVESYTNLLNEYGETPFGLKEGAIQQKIESVANNMAFNIDDETWKGSDKKSWEEFKFNHMPVAAVLPLLSQMQSDLKVSEANMVNDMASLAGGRVVEFDAFFPVVQADKAYVVGGEQFKAQISVGSYSSSLDPSNIRMSVNGTPLRIGADGKADFTQTASGSGPKTLNLKVAVTNPLTNKTVEGEGKYTYEVGSRSVAVSADKMNVFYIGVPNPLTVSAAGVSSNDVRVNFSGPIKGTGSGSKWVVNPTGQGDATITVTAKGQTLGSFPFRVKRIPDPQARLGSSTGGKIASGTFKAQQGVAAILDNFDFDARCNIISYDLIYAPKRDDAVLSTNNGAAYSAKSKGFVNRARPGDSYFFQDVKAKCPGDQVGRKINTMVFTIK